MLHCIEILCYIEVNRYIVQDRIFIIVSHDWKKIETRRLILNDEIKSEENSIPGNININIYCLNNHVVQVSVFENFKNVARFSFLSYNLIIGNRIIVPTTFTFTFIATRSTPINILSFIPYCPFPTIEQRERRERRGGRKSGPANLRMCALRIRIVITISQRLLDRLLCARHFGGRRFERLQAPVMDFEEGRSWLVSLYTGRGKDLLESGSSSN